MYDLGLSIIFLSELDPELYRSEINALMKLMIKWQKPVGGWGYLEGPHIDTGDTSMTQYAVLATDPAAVLAALWFHDVIYDPQRGDNEAASAAWATLAALAKQ